MDGNLFTLTLLLPAACTQPWTEQGGAPDPGMRSLGTDLNCSALIFAQLEPYMDENFISRAFATMGETVMSVKIIRNRLTGYVLSSPLVFSVLP